MRIFTRLREFIVSHKDLARRLDDLEKKYDSQFKVVFEAIRQLMTPPMTKKRKITRFSLTPVPVPSQREAGQIWQKSYSEK